MPPATQLRSDTELLVDQALSDLGIVFRDLRTPQDAEEALRDILPSLIAAYGAAAATAAADWYDDHRDELGVRGRFTAIPAQIDEPGAQALVGWALEEATDDVGLRSLIEGGTQRRIANFARGTVTGSSVADPQAQGWQRVSRGGCTTGFCDMLAGRGAVYSEESVDFASHDHCKCYAVPAFSGESKPVKPYTPSLRNISAGDRERTMRWLTGQGKAVAPSSLDDPAWLRHQLSIIEGLKESPWRTQQIDRFNGLLAKHATN